MQLVPFSSQIKGWLKQLNRPGRRSLNGLKRLKGARELPDQWTPEAGKLATQSSSTRPLRGGTQR